MLRIIGGNMGGRRIAAPQGRHTRPTSERVREGIFNVLHTLLPLEGARVLDLFAGSGALGIEALSRGAAHATLVESHGRTAGVIRSNLERLGIDAQTGRVVTAPVESWLAKPKPGAPFSLVLLDPPYEYSAHDRLLALLSSAPAVSGEAVIVLEAARDQAIAPPSSLDPIQTKRYGDTQVSFFRKINPESPREHAPH